MLLYVSVIAFVSLDWKCLLVSLLYKHSVNYSKAGIMFIHLGYMYSHNHLIAHSFLYLIKYCLFRVLGDVRGAQKTVPQKTRPTRPWLSWNSHSKAGEDEKQ